MTHQEIADAITRIWTDCAAEQAAIRERYWAKADLLFSECAQIGHIWGRSPMGGFCRQCGVCGAYEEPAHGEAHSEARS